MAVSSPESSRRRTPRLPACWPVLVSALALLGGAPASAQAQEITLDAASSDFDRRNERLIFKEVRIQQGDITISADHAESRDLDFSSGTWTFTGKVKIGGGATGDIESDRATVSFTNHRLTQATAAGAPARFARDMPGPDGRRVTGTARTIDYNLVRGELELAGDATLRDGLREVSGGRLVYRIAEDRLIASADGEGSERVRIVITPPEEENVAPEDAAPPQDDAP